jgi:transcription elongation factor GreA
MTTMTATDLLSSTGLMPDGPVLWGRPVPAHGPGVYVIELPSPSETAPLELTRIGKWIERVPELHLDGERPASRALAARLAAFWLPDQVVMYVGSSAGSVGARVASLERTVLGDRRPYGAAHWLHTLRGSERWRVWWAATDVPEEYEDALLETFAEAADGRSTPQPELVLPWAVLRRPTGERRAHGITGALLPEVTTVAPPTTVRDLPPGSADGVVASGPRLGGRREREAAERPSVSTKVPPAPERAPAPAPAPAAARTPARAPASSARHAGRPVEAVELSREGHARLETELDELRTVRRPAAIRRVATARELGDLRENAEYHSAREELGFIEGRIQQLEGRLRHAVIVEDSTSDRATIGSTVRVEVDGDEQTYRLVGSTEADPKSGRISTSSPVGRALLGHGAGADVPVEMPSGAVVRYHILEVG